MWGWAVDMVMLTHAKKGVGPWPPSRHDEPGNRVGNQLSRLPFSGSVASSHSRGIPGN